MITANESQAYDNLVPSTSAEEHEQYRALNEINLNDYSFRTLVKAEHRDPTWKDYSYSYDAREMLEDQAETLELSEAFECAIHPSGAEPSDSFNGTCFYEIEGEAGIALLKELAGKKLSSLAKGVRYMTGSVSVDIDTLIDTLDTAGIEVPRDWCQGDWFKENDYVVTESGTLLAEKAVTDA